MIEPNFTKGETEENIITMPTEKYNQLRTNIKEEIADKSKNKIIRRAINKKLKKSKAIGIVRKFLARKGSYRAMERQTIKLKRTPSYEGGRVALLNSGNSFFKR